MTPEDIEKLAAAYTQAWCDRSATAVASFFAEDGVSIVNDGDPAVGRTAISEAMGAFFADFPDLHLTQDVVRIGGNKVIYLWTLEGSNSGPGGTGNRVKISGWQNWRLNDDLLITEADGGYDALEYDRQIAGAG